MKHPLLPCCAMLIFSGVIHAEAVLGSKQTLLENDKVQVVRLVYPPNTESGMHSHQYPGRTVYVLKGGRLQLIPADKSAAVKTLQLTKDQVFYVPASTHNVKNIGDTEVILVETEIK